MGVLISLILAGLSTPATAAPRTHVEDFTTTTYKDPLHTTADWDSTAGELKLFALRVGADPPATRRDGWYPPVVDWRHTFLISSVDLAKALTGNTDHSKGMNTLNLCPDERRPAMRTLCPG